MDSSVSPKDEIWFLRVCHHISNAVYSSTLSLTTALDGARWSTPRRGRFIARERHQVPTVQKVVWAKEPTGVSRRIVEPVVSHCTDCVIAVHEIEMI
jgi:hypothetical protein